MLTPTGDFEMFVLKYHIMHGNPSILDVNTPVLTIGPGSKESRRMLLVDGWNVPLLKSELFVCKFIVLKKLSEGRLDRRQ